MAQDIVALTASLYDFIVDSEAPLSARKVSFESARERLTQTADELVQRFVESRDRLTARARQGCDDALRTLREMRAELAQRQPAQERLEALWKGLGESYESMRAQVRKLHMPLPKGVVLGAFKPKNPARNLFHISMALGSVLLYQFVLDRAGAIWVTGSGLALFAGMDILRRVSRRWNERFVSTIFSRIARPGEAHQVPAATWYIGALLIGSIALPQHAIQLGVLVLGFGDPVAQIIGKRFGKRKIIGQKSIAGALAFVVAATLAGFVFLSLVSSGGGALNRLGIVSTVALLGALVELYSGPMDDNFSIPLAAGLAAALLLY
ncbi:MAG: hypothetical protein RBU37_02635 [Myxococcota bacterium]|jgi:dolichol kinase|nr:hypothetical protein [Myxococcota bacterium]